MKSIVITSQLLVIFGFEDRVKSKQELNVWLPTDDGGKCCVHWIVKSPTAAFWICHMDSVNEASARAKNEQNVENINEFASMWHMLKELCALAVDRKTGKINENVYARVFDSVLFALPSMSWLCAVCALRFVVLMISIFIYIWLASSNQPSRCRCKAY